MSDYSTPFSDKLLDDESFDTIFGGQEDDELMGSVMKESDEAIVDDRDASGIEDGVGAPGAGSGLGSDLGTDHASKGAEAPKDDTSDQDVIAKDNGEQLKNDQLNTGDNAQGSDIKDGGQVNPADVRPEGDCQGAVDTEFGNTAPMEDKKVENIENFKEAETFEEAYNALVKELEEEGLADPADPAGVADEVPAEVVDSETPELPEEVPANDGVPADDVEAEYDDAVDALDSDEDEDDSIMDTLVGEEANVEDVAETRSTDGVEDGKKEDNLGDNLGPDSDNESKGGDAPKDDTSDNDVVDKESELKDDKLATSGDAHGDVKDGAQINPDDARVNGDTADAADDSFGKQPPIKEGAEEEKKEDEKAVDECGSNCSKNSAGGSGCEDCKDEEKEVKEASVPASEDDILEAAVLGIELEAAEEDLDAAEAEEDALLQDAKKDTAKSEFSTAELNEDEDDAIMNAVIGE